MASSSERRVEVLADTSFLMVPGMYGIDIISELERVIGSKFVLVVPSAVIAELERIARRSSGREGAAARIGLEIARRWGRVVEREGGADSVILEMARGRIVGTGDMELKGRLRRMGVPVVFLRGRDHLEVEGHMEG
jgi:rRNA-processing protein FCF1